MRQMQLLAIDPGVSTGWSLWRYSDTEPLEHLDHGTVHGGLHGFIDWWSGRPSDPREEVVAEDFILDGRTRMPDTTPLEILGALAVLHPATVRQRNVLKVHAPDDRLREWGLWWRGQGHDRDSARHAIAYMKLRRHAPTIAHYFPRKGTE